jgi:E3 ubiquitin-protein ligase BRE1
LQHQIVQGEEANMSIKADSRLTDAAQQTLQKENQILSERVRVIEQKAATQLELYRQEAKKNQLLSESATQFESQSKSLQVALDEQKTANKQLIMAQDLLISRIQELNTQYNQIVADTKKFRTEAEDARSAISKLEDERSSLNTKLNRSQRIGLSGSGTVDSRLKEELELYKNYYYCSVCRVNRNDTVLSQCGHITCRECVDKNVKSRSRKCPACSQSFATGDIVSVFYFS